MGCAARRGCGADVATLNTALATAIGGAGGPSPPGPSTSPGRFSTLAAWRWRVFAATWLCYAGLYFARKPFFIVKADLGDRLQLDAGALGRIGSVYLIAYTLGQFLAGGLGQRLGARKLLALGMVAAIIASIAFGFSTTALGLSIWMAINGLAQATGWSGAVGNMAQWFQRGERGTVMGLWATCYQVGGVGANAMAAWLLVRYGDRAAFFAGALVLSGVLLFFLGNQANRPSDKGFADFPEEPAADVTAAAAEKSDASADDAGATAAGDPSPPPDTAAGDPGWSRQTWNSVLLVGGFYFFVKFIRYALWSWAPFLLRRNFGLDGDDAGYLSTLFDLAGIVGVIGAGWLSDRYFAGRRAAVSLYLLLGMVLSTLLLATAGAQDVTIFAIAISLCGLCLYGPDALMTGAGAMDIGSRRGAILAAGIINGMGSVGSIVQELLIGGLFVADAAAGGAGTGTAQVLGLLLAASVGAVAFLGAVVWRNRRGLSDA